MMASTSSAAPFATGFAMTESPRWYNHRLWFVDMHTHRVLSAGLDGGTEVMAELDGETGGIGWLQDGRLLVVAQDKCQILRQEEDGELVVHCDLSGDVNRKLNDMWVDDSDRAYVGEMSFDAHEWFEANPDVVHSWFSGEAQVQDVPATSRIFIIEPDGSSRVGASGLIFPNGLEVDASTKTLVVAETFGARVSFFDVDSAGDLTFTKHQSLGFYPDGLALDGAEAMWIADPVNKQARQFDLATGEVHQRAVTDQICIACAIGGEGEERTAFLCSAPTTEPDAARAGLGGRVDRARIE